MIEGGATNFLDFLAERENAIIFLFILSLLYEESSDFKVVSATFLLVCFACLKEGTCETRKNVFYFTSKSLFVLEIIKF